MPASKNALLPFAEAGAPKGRMSALPGAFGAPPSAIGTFPRKREKGNLPNVNRS